MTRFSQPSTCRSLLSLLLCVSSIGSACALQTLEVAWLQYNGEHDRCRWVCPGAQTSCVAPEWYCSRGTGLLDFNADDKTFLRQAFGVIIDMFSSKTSAELHYECVDAVTTDWQTVEAAPKSVRTAPSH